MAEVLDVETWGCLVVFAAPNVEVLLTDCFKCLIFLQPLDLAVVLFVELPVLEVLNPVQIQLICNRVVSPDRSLKH